MLDSLFYIFQMYSVLVVPAMYDFVMRSSFVKCVGADSNNNFKKKKNKKNEEEERTNIIILLLFFI